MGTMRAYASFGTILFLITSLILIGGFAIDNWDLLFCGNDWASIKGNSFHYIHLKIGCGAGIGFVTFLILYFIS